MKYGPKNTLSALLNIPQVTAKNIGYIQCSDISPKILEYWKTVEKEDKEAIPEREAITFYCLNHLLSVLRKKFDKNEPLPEWAIPIVNAYTFELANQGKRLFSYILLVTTRESRHVKTVNLEIVKKNKVMKEWVTSIRGHDSISVAKRFCEYPPQLTLGEYMPLVVNVFNEGSFTHGYGGPPWGTIAECLRKMISGETSIEVMVDTAYTLAHNNGPMFNKGMLYVAYQGDWLLKVLDVQRSGQIPEFLWANEAHSSFVDSKLLGYIADFRNNFPGEIGDYVDWHKVVELGAKSQYPLEISKQDKLHPPKVAKGTLLQDGDVEIMPGVKLTKVKRAA